MMIQSVDEVFSSLGVVEVDFASGALFGAGGCTDGDSLDVNESWVVDGASDNAASIAFLISGSASRLIHGD